MSKRFANPDLRREIALRFNQAIEARGLSKTEAAAQLRISRQTLWLYLNEKATPGGEVLERACQLWGLSITYKGVQFKKGAFAPEVKPRRTAGRQLSLLDLLEKLKDDQLETEVVGRVGEYFELRVRIRSLA